MEPPCDFGPQIVYQLKESVVFIGLPELMQKIEPFGSQIAKPPVDGFKFTEQFSILLPHFVFATSPSRKFITD